MKFKYSVIFENTDDARKWLEKLGYKLENQHEDGEYLVTHLRLHNSTPLYWCAVPLKQDKHVGSINCIGNYPLFKAVSAMRDDSDYMQWFVCQASLSDCATCKGEFTLSHDKAYQTSQMDGSFWDKATLTELQERFKEKER